MPPTPEKQLLRHAILGVAGLCAGAVLWMIQLATRGHLQPEYVTVMRLAAISMILSASFWLVTAWIANMRDASR